MREKVKRTFLNFESAIENLKSAIKETTKESEINDLNVDGTIKRFELCYELSWKMIKVYLEDLGIICKNPRDCYKQAKINDLIFNDEIWMEMIDARNRLVHEYSLNFSRIIFQNIVDKYFNVLEELYKEIKNRIEQDY
ncbi:MAG: HI0074 family nucleotidyltransferase substrate-binding subunit [Desulfonauticus sp.]|nr:HI0074 family nucleotidyltransferase substrate-binding subunit [Desulfonauticus sp.]